MTFHEMHYPYSFGLPSNEAVRPPVMPQRNISIACLQVDDDPPNEKVDFAPGSAKDFGVIPTPLAAHPLLVSHKSGGATPKMPSRQVSARHLKIAPLLDELKISVHKAPTTATPNQRLLIDLLSEDNSNIKEKGANTTSAAAASGERPPRLPQRRPTEGHV